MIEAVKILSKPSNYFTISETWTEEKSVVFPLSAFPNAFPTKSHDPIDPDDDADMDEEKEFDEENATPTNRSSQNNVSKFRMETTLDY